MNNKGFTLVELLVSFTLSMIIVIILFQLIINLKEVYMSSGLKTELLNKQSLITNKIYTDLLDKQVMSIEDCTNPLICINFNFSDGTSKRLELDEINNTLSYDNYVIKLNNNSYFKDIDIKTKTTLVENGNYNGIFNINIPIYNNLFQNTDFGIDIVYMYNSNQINNTYPDKFITEINN